jgi:hypothetical protein
VILQRERSAAGRIAARIVGGVAGAVGIDRTDDRIAVRFDRAVPHAAAVADHVTIDLGETPRGTYRLTLEVTDTVTGRVASRTATLVIR